VDNPTIIDQDGQEQNWDWLAANFGSVELVRPQVSAEHTAVYRLCRLLDVEGPAAQVVHVLDQDGNPPVAGRRRGCTASRVAEAS
jgi:hypothetical protein